MTDYTELVKALRRCQFGLGMCAECPYYGHKGKWNGEDLSDCDDKMHIDAAAAIEALEAEVKRLEPKRGEWIDRYDEDDKPFFKRKYVCSACGGWNTYGKSKYCPNCGAKMEGQDAKNSSDNTP